MFGLREEDLVDFRSIKQNARQCHTLLLPSSKMNAAFAGFIVGRAGGLEMALKVREGGRFCLSLSCNEYKNRYLEVSGQSGQFLSFRPFTRDNSGVKTWTWWNHLRNLKRWRRKILLCCPSSLFSVLDRSGRDWQNWPIPWNPSAVRPLEGNPRNL